MSASDKNHAPRQVPPDLKARDERLKAALQANIAKRKTLAKAKAAPSSAAPDKDRSEV